MASGEYCEQDTKVDMHSSLISNKNTLNMKTVLKIMAFKILNALVPLKRLTT